NHWSGAYDSRLCMLRKNTASRPPCVIFRCGFFPVLRIRGEIMGTSKNSKIKACGRDKSGVYIST
ncbi:MAG: hypothetical protein LBJ21_09760, partial [Acidobacteriota bacterium]|nr:hypothetical protein [Acidobacteriota bacterium]